MSSYFEWMDSFSINVPSVDDDHKILVSLTNEVVTAIQQGYGPDTMNDALSRLLEYTGYHFDREENLMQLHRFPELEAHRAQHNSLIRHVILLQRQCRANELDPVKLGEFLIDWLTTHILREDMKLGQHIARQGVG